MKAILLFIISLLVPNSLLASPAEDISQEDFISRQQSDSNFLLLDVRSAEEFAKGHIEGAKNISHSEIVKRINELPKDIDLIIYCRSGKRAGIAAKLLTKYGFEKLYHLDGDMNGWLEKNRPVVEE